MVRDGEYDVRDQGRGSRSAGGDFRVQRAEDDVWWQAHRQRRSDLRLRERERRRARSHRERRRHLGQSDRKETRDRPANAAREHHHQTHRPREAAPGAERAQAFFRLERRSTRDRAQFQVLSSGNEQDRQHLGSSGGVPPRIVLTRAIPVDYGSRRTRIGSRRAARRAGTSEARAATTATIATTPRSVAASVAETPYNRPATTRRRASARPTPPAQARPTTRSPWPRNCRTMSARSAPSAMRRPTSRRRSPTA